MARDFGQDAAQLIIKSKIDFYGYRVMLCPITSKNPAPRITADLQWNCYCINLPVEFRGDWLLWATRALEIIYERVICNVENHSGNAASQ